MISMTRVSEAVLLTEISISGVLICMQVQSRESRDWAGSDMTRPEQAVSAGCDGGGAAEGREIGTMSGRSESMYSDLS